MAKRKSTAPVIGSPASGERVVYDGLQALALVALAQKLIEDRYGRLCTTLKPGMYEFFKAEARKIVEDDQGHASRDPAAQLPTQFLAEDHGATAKVTLKRKAIRGGGLPQAARAHLTRHGIPMRVLPAQYTVNPLHADNAEAFADVRTLILQALAEDATRPEPKWRIPLDFLIHQEPRSLPYDDMLYRVLRLGLPDDDLKAILNEVAELAIGDIDLTDIAAASQYQRLKERPGDESASQTITLFQDLANLVTHVVSPPPPSRQPAAPAPPVENVVVLRRVRTTKLVVNRGARPAKRSRAKAK